MISSKDRSYYIGASDTSYVVGNWTTKSFEKWYATKLGFYEMNFVNEAMLAGTYLEHRILDFLKIPELEKDKQKIEGRLRVNLDGNTKDTIYEVKTYRKEKGFHVSKKYREQVLVQMYFFQIPKAFIIAYGLEEKDYKNFFLPIEGERIFFHPVEYEHEFLEKIYLPRMWYLSKCLDKGVFPTMEEFKQSYGGD